MEQENQKSVDFQQLNIAKNEKKKKLIFIVFLICLTGVLLGYSFKQWFKMNISESPLFQPSLDQEKSTEKEDDFVSEIDEEIEKNEILDLEEEFKTIDQDLNFL